MGTILVVELLYAAPNPSILPFSKALITMSRPEYIGLPARQEGSGAIT
jgi:hypothetical protein